MSSLYKLNFVPQALQQHAKAKNFRNNDSLKLYTLQDGTLKSCEYANGNWKQISLLNSIHVREIYFTNLLVDGQSMFIVKTERGIIFYRRNGNQFETLFKTDDYEDDNFFDDKFFGWDKPGSSIKMGRIYSDSKLLGIVGQRREQDLRIFAIMTDQFESDAYPIQTLKSNFDIFGNITGATIALSDLKKNGHDNIIIHGESGLDIYQINQDLDVEHQSHVRNSGKLDDSPEQLFFPNLTGRPHRDIALLNATGLFVYQSTNRNHQHGNYEMISYVPLFSKLKGWRSEHTETIQFEDIDLDGRQDMIFTGPQGISVLSFDTKNNEWNLLLDNSELTVAQRHSSVMKVIPANPPGTQHPWILTKYKNQLYAAKIEAIKENLQPNTTLQPSAKLNPSLPPVIPPISELLPETKYPTPLLHDQLDYTTIFQAIGNAGKPNFHLPLVDLSARLSNLRLDVVYDGNDHTSDVLGVGWSMPRTYIALVSPSIFPEDDVYYLVLDGSTSQLIFEPSASNDDRHSFVSSNQRFPLTAFYHKNEEKWEITSDYFKQTYGGYQNGATVWSFKGKHMRSGSDQRYASVWNLVTTEDKRKNLLRYTYETINVSRDTGKPNTQEVYLKSISNIENQIIFSYSNKDESEYDSMSQKNVNGRPVRSRYLIGYTVTTLSYQQAMNCVYEVNNGKRLLIEIQQTNDITNQPVLQFSYAKISDAYVMQKIVLPTTTFIVFDSQLQKTVAPQNANMRIVEVKKIHRVDYGSDYTIVSYLDFRGRAVLTIYNIDMSEELYSSFAVNPTKQLPIFGKGSATFYNIYVFEHFIAIILTYNADKEVHLLRRNGSKWSQTPKLYNFDDKAIIRNGKDFIVVAGESAIQVISWNNDNRQWETVEPFTDLRITEESLMLSVSGRFIVTISNNSVLFIGYKGRYNRWQQTKINIPNIVNDINGTIDRFEIDSDSRKTLFRILKNVAIKVSDNYILLNRWTVDGMQLYSEIDTFVLDSSYTVAKSQTIKVLQDNLETFSKDVEQDGSTYTVGYTNDDNIFKIAVPKVRGEIALEFERLYGNASMRRKKLKAFLDLKAKSLADSFLLEPSNYIADFMAQQIVCRNKHFTFTGDRWVEETKVQSDDKNQSFSLPIGKKYVLHKNDASSSIRLHQYNNDASMLGDMIFNLDVLHLNQTLIKYPSYLAYQKDNQVSVVLFSNDGSIAKTYILPRYEDLSELGSFRTLVTSLTENDGKKLIFRQQNDIDRLATNIVTRQTTTHFEDGMKRVMGYEFGEARAFGEAIFYEKIIKIPNNDKSVFGWIEETVDFKKSLESQQHAYNTDGVFVKTLKSEDKSQENDADADVTKAMEKYFNQNSTLFDRSGKLKIAQTFPYRLTDEDVAYFGFEDYEAAGTSIQKWEFDGSNVVRNGFSFTGNNFLRLTNKALAAEFQLGKTNQPYIVSSWMRPQNATFQLGQTVPYLKAVISTEDPTHSYSYIATGEIKFQLNDWFYVEVILDLFTARESLNNVRKVQGNSVATSDIDLMASITAVPSADVTIDIDHIRFAPLSSIFAVNVYDSKTFQLKEVIAPSGLVERHFYDQHLKEIASINEYGELRKLETYTKASSIGRMSQPKCIVEIKPESGFYEHFAPVSFHDRWEIESNTAWRISPGLLEHVSGSTDTIKLQKSYEMINTSHGLRLFYNLQSNNAFIQFNNGLRLDKRNRIGRAVLLHKERPIPSDGEILIVVEGRRIFAWIDGGLYFDEYLYGTLSNLTIEIGGETKISDLIVLYMPNVKVSYYNTFGEKLQQITLESENASVATGYRYDALGRHTVITRSLKIKSSSHHLLAYNSNVVGNIKDQSYTEIKYCNNPLSEKCAVLSPGHTFSKLFSYSSDDLFITNLFPLNENYSYQVEHRIGNVKITSVFDDKNNRVAWYMLAPKAKSLLSTYKYDQKGKLLQSLPPAYHTSVNTFHKIVDPVEPNYLQEEKEKVLKNLLGTNIIYDENGHILSKTTPDTGRIENIYTENGLLAFVLQFSNENVDKILYFDYDHFDRLRSSGIVTSTVQKEQLLNLKLNSGNTKVFQQFSYNDFEHSPLMRGKKVRTITYNHGEPFIEESISNIDEETISKLVYVSNDNDQRKEPDIFAISKVYRAGKLKQIQYPLQVGGEQFNVAYEYNKLGNIARIGVPGHANQFVSFTYNPDGQIINETHEAWSANNFTRQYEYNSAGFLTVISDRFLTENLHHTEGYGSYGYNDGTILRTDFEANWHAHSDDSQLGLNENSFVDDDLITPEVSSACFNELTRTGYLNDAGRQVKTFYPSLEPELPILCRFGASGHRIRNILGKSGFPTRYGHSYDYGSYQELAKAKYFVGNEAQMSPLQSDSFAKEIRGIDETMSRDIWMRLTQSKYLIDDNSKMGSFLGHGKRGFSFINSLLREDLKNMGEDYEVFASPLENLLTAYFSEGRTTISPETLLKWNMRTETEELRQIASNIARMLNDRGYVKNPLSREFYDVLQPYHSYLREIVRVLFEHLSRALGEAEFDTESYQIDENGNHRLFYTGFDRYEIDYHNNTNQISNVIIRLSALQPLYFPVKHDRHGNVIQAMHRGIQRIDYNPISNRATKIQLANGITISFYYDARGERVLKRVFDSTGRTTKEVHYTRDEFGRALVERQLTYIRSDLPPDVLFTAYIYGPKGLIGFIRRDQFYSVIADHEGSIRLVVKNNEVVAAYDYLPYGGLMRVFGNDPNAHISYRYTGQEWDDETGLYNYHARFYDPSIGRFYQIDPEEQYFSPYKYSGNSPVSMVDSDGRLAWFILVPVAIGFGLLGAYLGGAAANGEWDFKKWDWSHRSTYFGIFGGGIAGALLPIGAVGSVSTLTAVGMTTVEAILATSALGLAGAYLSMGAVNNNWDPSKWDLSSPETWNAAFQGIAAGTSLPAGIGGARHAYINISSNFGKGFFIAGSMGFGTASFVLNGIYNNWDLSKPGMYFGFIQVFDDATNIPAFFRSSMKSIGSSIESIQKGIQSGSNAFKIGSMVATKMALKGFGISAAAVLLAVYYDGVDLKDPTALFFIVRQMGSVNMHYSITKGFKNSAKEYIRNRNANKYQRLHEHDRGIDEFGDESHAVCRRSLGSCSNDRLKGFEEEPDLTNEYDKLHMDFSKRMNDKAVIEMVNKGTLTDASFQKSKYYLADAIAYKAQALRAKALDALKAEKIKSGRAAAIAVGFSEKFAVVGFSGLKDLGAMFVFGIRKHSDFGYMFEYFDGFVLKDNAYIVKVPATLMIDADGNIINKQTADITNFKLIEKGSKLVLHLDKERSRQIQKDLNDREIDSFTEFIAKKQEEGMLFTKEFSDYVKSEIENRLDADIKYEETDVVLANIIETALKNYPPQNGAALAVSTLAADYKTSRKAYYDKNDIPTWLVKNCAEIHVVNGYKLLNTNVVLREMLTFRIKPKKDLSIDGSKMEVFPPCGNCVVTTKEYLDPRTEAEKKLTDPPLPSQPTDAADSQPNESSNSGRRQRIRPPGSSRRKRLAFYESNPTEIETNSTAYVSNRTTSSRIPCDFNRGNCDRKSLSFFNNVFGWMGQQAGRVGGLLNNWIDTTSNSESECGGKALNIDASQIQQNGTILLFDVLIRKFTAQKYKNSHQHNRSEQEARGFAIQITAEFEEMLEHEFDGLDIDFPKIQREIFKKIFNCKLDGIFPLLSLHIQKACHGQGKDVCFSSEKYTNMLAILDKKLSVLLSSWFRC